MFQCCKCDTSVELRPFLLCRRQSCALNAFGMLFNYCDIHFLTLIIISRAFVRKFYVWAVWRSEGKSLRCSCTESCLLAADLRSQWKRIFMIRTSPNHAYSISVRSPNLVKIFVSRTHFITSGACLLKQCFRAFGGFLLSSWDFIECWPSTLQESFIWHFCVKDPFFP